MHRAGAGDLSMIYVRFVDDLRPRRPVAAAGAAPERAAVFGDLQPGPDRVLRAFRADFSRLATGAIGACGDRGPYEAGGAPAPAGGRGDPSARSAVRLSALAEGNGRLFVKCLCM